VIPKNFKILDFIGMKKTSLCSSSLHTKQAIIVTVVIYPSLYKLMKKLLFNVWFWCGKPSWLTAQVHFALKLNKYTKKLGIFS